MLYKLNRETNASFSLTIMVSEDSTNWTEKQTQAFSHNNGKWMLDKLDRETNVSFSLTITVSECSTNWTEQPTQGK